jgi:hypothetical protein
MGLERDFLSLSTEVLSVQSLSTASAYGAPTYSTAVTYPVFEEPGARLVVTALGVEEVTTATLYVLSTTASIGLQDKVTLPDGRVPKLLRVDVLRDDEGQHHLEVAIR